LLGYLLGALEDHEHEQVERQLEHDPELRAELNRVEARLERLGPADQHFEPPVGLAARTCQAVANRIVTDRPMPREARIHWGMSMFDVVVAAGVFAAAALLFFPAILNSRYQSELAYCQNNLREFARALSSYADVSDGIFPKVPSEGNRAVAGVYAPILIEEGYLTEAGNVVCPSSELARAGDFRVPTLREMDSARGAELARVQSLVGGSYAYNLGYLQDRVHMAARHLGRPTFAIMSDAPSEHLIGRMSANHGGRGQNVLFDDMHVEYLNECRTQDCRDSLFVNNMNLVGAGVNENDIVLGASDASPNVRLVGGQ
jgi:hypothetical protein